MELREARENANYTQQEVADYLAISRPTYIAMEQNPSKVPVGTARKLSDLFNVSVNDIFFSMDCKQTSNHA